MKNILLLEPEEAATLERARHILEEYGGNAPDATDKIKAKTSAENIADLLKESNAAPMLKERQKTAETLANKIFDICADPWTETREESTKYNIDLILNNPPEIIAYLLDLVEMWQKVNDEK
jgi:hypothetical protein